MIHHVETSKKHRILGERERRDTARGLFGCTNISAFKCGHTTHHSMFIKSLLNSLVCTWLLRRWSLQVENSYRTLCDRLWLFVSVCSLQAYVLDSRIHAHDLRLWAAVVPVVMPRAHLDCAVSLLSANWAVEIVAYRGLYSDRPLGWWTCIRHTEAQAHA